MPRRSLSSFFAVFKGKKSPNFVVPQKKKRRIAELVEEEVVLDGEIKETTSLADRAWYLKQKYTIRWELETYIIQNSTRTALPQCVRQHNWLRMKYKGYYNGHLLP